MGRAPTPAPLSASEQDAHIRLCELHGNVAAALSYDHKLRKYFWFSQTLCSAMRCSAHSFSPVAVELAPGLKIG